MNKVILIGRLTKEPDIRVAEESTVGKYTLAVDRYSKNGNETDFINCVTFGKAAEFTEKYLHKGMKIAIEGSIKTGSYTNNEGHKVYTTDVIVNAQEFCESKGNDSTPANKPTVNENGFMNIPDNLEDDGLPF